MSELSKVVSYSTILAVTKDFEAVQTLTVDFICFQNKKLLDLKHSAILPLLARHTTYQTEERTDVSL